ncbi:GH3 auxin-responsive promoter family protein [Methanobrevibacter sp.]|uniref:GH3 auxin-responsive promoter family protein n=1 Tax=Methanobrevibacter sp. TaxID=66852 RepID=UPI003D7E6370
MVIYKKLDKLKPTEIEKVWLKYCHNCRETQNTVLENILKINENTEFGIKNGFKEIRSIEDFQKNVPLSQYSDYDEYIEQLKLGKNNQLFDQDIEYFIMTSGTSSGKSKLIPENEDSKNIKNTVYKLRNYYLLKTLLMSKADPNSQLNKYLISKELNPKDVNVPELANIVQNMHYLTFSSKTDNYKTSAGIPIGFASGMSFEKSSFTNGISYPPRLMTKSDDEANNYLVMLFSLRFEDILYITTNNASNFNIKVEYAMDHAEELINDLRNGTITERLNLSDEDRQYYESQMEAFPERADFLEELLKKGKDQFIPKNYWPYVMLTKFWLGGSVGPNSETSRKYLDKKTIFFDVGYGASEAKLTIPTKPDNPEGILSIFGGFYEFKDLENNQIFTADEVELNKEYELIITTYGGLYRYELHDIVEITGFTGTTPNLIFKTKSGEMLNISQEKIPAIEVVNKIKDEMCLSFKQAQIFENHDEKNYEIYVELEKETQIDVDELSGKLNEILIESFELYELYNRMGLMTPLKIILMKNGWVESLYSMKSKGNVPKSQIKLPLIITERPNNEYIL